VLLIKIELNGDTGTVENENTCRCYYFVSVYPFFVAISQNHQESADISICHFALLILSVITGQWLPVCHIPTSLAPSQAACQTANGCP